MDYFKIILNYRSLSQREALAKIVENVLFKYFRNSHVLEEQAIPKNTSRESVINNIFNFLSSSKPSCIDNIEALKNFFLFHPLLAQEIHCYIKDSEYFPFKIVYNHFLGKDFFEVLIVDSMVAIRYKNNINDNYRNLFLLRSDDIVDNLRNYFLSQRSNLLIRPLLLETNEQEQKEVMHDTKRSMPRR